MVEQAGGHAGAFSEAGVGRIQKKVGKNEYNFYKNINDYPFLIPFAPTCFDCVEKDGEYFVVMEDLTHGLQRPCFMDIKMGTSSVGEDASPEKAASMRKKDISTTTAELGVRIVGMKYYDEEKKDFIKHGKPYGKARTKDNVVEGMLQFFGSAENRKKLLPPILEQLQEIKTMIENQDAARIYSSSILFVYDSAEGSEVKPIIRMIDFAHVHPITDGGKDEGYIIGINNLITYLQ